MSEVEQGLETFLHVILASDVYKEYKEALLEVKKQPTLKAQIDDYRKRNYDLQMSQDMDFAKLEAFRVEYLNFRKDPLVDRFLASELALCRMMQEIEFRLTEALDFE